MSGKCISCGIITAGKGVRCKKCANTVKNQSIEHRLKNSKANLGINNHFYCQKHTIKTLEKISGENSVHYIDGRTKKFNDWQKAILKRDRSTCRICGKTNKERRIDCHHIKPKIAFPNLEFEVENGIALCIKHHQIYENQPNKLLRKIHVR